MIGVAHLPRDDDKALLSPEEQRKVDLKVHFNRNMAKSPSTCTTKRDANVISNPVLLNFFLYKEFPYVK